MSKNIEHREVNFKEEYEADRGGIVKSIIVVIGVVIAAIIAMAIGSIILIGGTSSALMDRGEKFADCVVAAEEANQSIEHCEEYGQ